MGRRKVMEVVGYGEPVFGIMYVLALAYSI